MAKTKQQKKEILKELKTKIKNQTIMMIVDFTGLKVDEALQLRNDLREVEGELKVAKKTLIQIALEENNFKKNIKEMEGEIALVFGYGDKILPAKAIYNFTKKSDNLKILGGFFENQFEEKDKFVQLAQLPSKQELLGRLVGSVSSPISGFVRSLNYNLKGLVFALNAIKENK
jgi:large subunit ribosomal protein L10